MLIPIVIVFLFGSVAVAQSTNATCDQFIACGTNYLNQVQAPLASQNMSEICRLGREYYRCAFASSCYPFPASYSQTYFDILAKVSSKCQLSCPKPADGAINTRKVCTAYGDPHLTTFDGKHFTVGATSQTLFEDDWLLVRTRNQYLPGTGNIPWIAAVLIQYKNCTNFQVKIEGTGTSLRYYGVGAHIVSFDADPTQVHIQLRGINTDILISGTSAPLRISIASPFWQTAKGDCTFTQATSGVLDATGANNLFQNANPQWQTSATQMCSGLPDTFKQGCMVDVALSGNKSLAAEAQAANELHNDAVAMGDGFSALDFAIYYDDLPIGVGISIGLVLAGLTAFVFLWLNKKVKEDPIAMSKKFPSHRPALPNCCSTTQTLPVIRLSAIIVPSISVCLGVPFFVVGVAVPESGLLGAFGVILLTHVVWTKKTSKSLGLLYKQGPPTYIRAVIKTQYAIGVFTGVTSFLLLVLFSGASVIEVICFPDCLPSLTYGQIAIAISAWTVTFFVFVALVFHVLSCAFVWVTATLLLQFIETPLEDQNPQSNVTTFVAPVIAATQPVPEPQQMPTEYRILVEKDGTKQILEVGAVFLSSLELFKGYLHANGLLSDKNQNVEVWHTDFSEYVSLTDINTVITQSAPRIKIEN